MSSSRDDSSYFLGLIEDKDNKLCRSVGIRVPTVVASYPREFVYRCPKKKNRKIKEINVISRYIWCSVLSAVLRNRIRSWNVLPIPLPHIQATDQRNDNNIMFLHLKNLSRCTGYVARNDSLTVLTTTGNAMSHFVLA